MSDTQRMPEAPEDADVLASNGDLFRVTEDSEQPGVMIDKYLNRADVKPCPVMDVLNEIVLARLADKGIPPPHDESEPDDYLIVPASAVRQLGEALIEWADYCEAMERLEADDE